MRDYQIGEKLLNSNCVSHRVHTAFGDAIALMPSSQTIFHSTEKTIRKILSVATFTKLKLPKYENVTRQWTGRSSLFRSLLDKQDEIRLLINDYNASLAKDDAENEISHLDFSFVETWLDLLYGPYSLMVKNVQSNSALAFESVILYSDLRHLTKSIEKNSNDTAAIKELKFFAKKFAQTLKQKVENDCLLLQNYLALSLLPRKVYRNLEIVSDSEKKYFELHLLTYLNSVECLFDPQVESSSSEEDLSSDLSVRLAKRLRRESGLAPSFSHKKTDSFVIVGGC